MGEETLHELLEAVAEGRYSPAEVADKLASRRSTDLGFAVVDDERAARTGSPEIVYGAGKTADQVAELFDHLDRRGTRALATRVHADVIAELLGRLPRLHHAEPGLLYRAPQGQPALPEPHAGPIVVACAGTSDLPVAHEALLCARWFGLRAELIADVGVAGLHRLLDQLPTLRAARALIVVAGMEGALPSVVAGLVRAPVIAVPTSTGYGANLGGIGTMLSMVNSCAGGVAVVNVDNGFGAAQVVARILATP